MKKTAPKRPASRAVAKKTPAKKTAAALEPVGSSSLDDFEQELLRYRSEHPLLWASIDADARAKATASPIDVAIADLLEAVSLFERRRAAQNEPRPEIARKALLNARRAVGPYLSTTRRGGPEDPVIEQISRSGRPIRRPLDEQISGARRPLLRHERDDGERIAAFEQRVAAAMKAHQATRSIGIQKNAVKIDDTIARSLIEYVQDLGLLSEIAADAHRQLSAQCKQLRLNGCDAREYMIATLGACGVKKPANLLR